MVPPLLLPMFAFIAKNATFANAYVAAQTYGFPRLYKRLSEGVKVLVPKQQQVVVRDAIKLGIRAPVEMYKLSTNLPLVQFLKSYAEMVAQGSVLSKTPPFVVSFAQALMRKTSFGKVLDILEKAAMSKK